MEIAVDPVVSRRKFDRELANYRQLADCHLDRGWWLLKAEFPQVFVVFATPKTNPPSVVCGVLVDFTNYDFQPPSLQIVNPFTRVPYKAQEVPIKLLRVQNAPAPGAPPIINLLVAHRPEDVPFVCLPGVREYHDHPAHKGDLWELRRGTPEGTLYFLLDQIYKYGIAPIAGHDMQIQIQAVIRGFQNSSIPQ